MSFHVQLNEIASKGSAGDSAIFQSPEINPQVKLSQDNFARVAMLGQSSPEAANSYMAKFGFPTPSFDQGPQLENKNTKSEVAGKTLLANDREAVKQDKEILTRSPNEQATAKLQDIVKAITEAQQKNDYAELAKASLQLDTLSKQLAGNSQTGGDRPQQNQQPASTAAEQNKGISSGTSKAPDTTSKETMPTATNTGSNATAFGTSAEPTINQSAPGFYVSPDGSAKGDGSEAHPFATLQQAQQAMEKSSTIKTTYVEGGTYKMGSTLNLTKADSGESFIDVGGASNPAVLDGGGKLSDLISLNQANNVRIEGFQMQNTTSDAPWDPKQNNQVKAGVGAIFAQDSSNDVFSYNTIKNSSVGINVEAGVGTTMLANSIDNVQTGIALGSDASGNYGSNNDVARNSISDVTGIGKGLYHNMGAVTMVDETNATVSGNVINDTAGVGIEANFGKVGSGFTIANNTITNTDTAAAASGKPDTTANPVGDDGAIHIIEAKGTEKDLNGVVSGNMIENVGIANGVNPKNNQLGIYADNWTSGVTFTGNYINTGGDGYAMQIHGGNDNIVSGNNFDMGTTGSGIKYQALDGGIMTGNEIENNWFTAEGNAQKAYAFLQTVAADDPTFSGNIYDPGINQSPDPNGTTA